MLSTDYGVNYTEIILAPTNELFTDSCNLRGNRNVCNAFFMFFNFFMRYDIYRGSIENVMMVEFFWSVEM